MNTIDYKTDISKISWINERILPLWVYASLRREGKFHAYLVDCSTKVGDYDMVGCAMEKPGTNDTYVRKDKGDLEKKASGELYRVSLVGLWRIFRLANSGSSFPQGYDLDVSNVSSETDEEKKDVALWFRLREDAVPAVSLDIQSLFKKMLEVFKDSEPNLSQNDIDEFLRVQLRNAGRFMPNE